MRLNINKTELVKLVSKSQPNSINECLENTKIGLMKYSGNQHNEKWDWVNSELSKLSEYELNILYERYKNN